MNVRDKRKKERQKKIKKGIGEIERSWLMIVIANQHRVY